MKTKAMAAMMMAVAGAALAGTPERKVTVCMKVRADAEIHRARATATTMFAEIGVRLEWRGDRACPTDAIHISLSNATPEKELPGALAYALPYEGTSIVIFYDRVRSRAPQLVAPVLAHVLVHEVTHILQAVNRHSESGVMKARWGTQDFSFMVWKPLPFTDLDVILIHRGLDGRAERLLASR
jgi:hypothetical protein